MAQEKSSTRRVEMYVGKPDKTWYTVIVEEPVSPASELEDEEVSERARKRLEAKLVREGVEFSFLGVYYLFPEGA